MITTVARWALTASAWTLVASLSACSTPANNNDAGSDVASIDVSADNAPLDVPVDTTTADTPADTVPCTGCVNHALSWSYQGGLVAYTDSSALSGCSTVTFRRDPSGGPQGSSCSADLQSCGSGGSVTVTDVVTALANSDVVAAIAAAPVLYGVDTRPVDGAVFVITVDGHQISVGVPCQGTSGCIEIPAGVATLKTMLETTTQQTLNSAACRAVFGSG